MKANELPKKSITIEMIYKEIEDMCKSEKNFSFKHFIPHWIYVSDNVKLQLINDGFKIYNGEFLNGDKGLIIEW